MVAFADWLGKVVRQINQAEGRLTPVERKRLKLGLLLRSARRVAVYSSECATCRALQGHIADISGRLATWEGPVRDLRGYPELTIEITRHLRLAHRLVDEQHYVKRLVLAGLAFGVSTVGLGLVLVNFGVTVLTLGVTLPALAMRVAFSYTVGRLLDRRAKRRGRVL